MKEEDAQSRHDRVDYVIASFPLTGPDYNRRNGGGTGVATY